MARLIFLALVALLAFMLWRWLVRRLAGGEARKLLTADLVRCTACGTHVPRGTAVRTADGWRCGEHAPEDNE